MAQFREQFDVQLDDHCASRIETARRMHPRYEMMWQTIRQHLSAGGKRIRPYILAETYKAYATEPDITAIMPAALAQELIHQAMLVHDDIIDRDMIRYGNLNITGQYDKSYASDLSDDTERTHMAESASILAGDVLLSEAYRLLSQVDSEPERIAQATLVLSEGVFEVVAGELLDTENSFLSGIELSAETIARYKTVSYSFASPLMIGAILAGAPEDQITLLKKYAYYVGVGFQLRDDLLGVFGDDAKTGKSSSGDIVEGKRTYLIEQFESHADEALKTEFSRLFHRSDVTPEDIDRCRALLIESGAKTRVEEKIDQLHSEADAIITQLDITDQGKGIFDDLTRRCLTREA